jgi:(heptosyl)LPS beta-1,4-glucosyltransferase
MKEISICYITLNAEKYLQESLQQSKKLSNDIVIVDSGSTDSTLTIAQIFQANIIQQAWLGFSKQKQLAINSANHDWVLLLDADEILTDEAIKEIKETLLNDDSTTAYSLPRQNWFQGKWIKHGSWWPDRVVRLFDRKKGQMKPVPVHECWETNGEVKALNNPIKHYSFDNYSALLKKADHYSTLAAEQLFAKGKECSTWSPLTHAFASFIRLFVLKQGFRDGIEGAAIAYTNGLGSFLKYAKLQELHRKKANRQA